MDEAVNSAIATEGTGSAAHLASVAALRARHHDDIAHSDQVCALATAIFVGTIEAHRVSPIHLPVLRTGALLHNVGLEEDEENHHTVGRDIVMREGLRGFDADRTRMVACLVAFHRKTVRAKDEPLWKALPPDLRDATLRMAAILRIADALDWNQTHANRIVRIQGRKGPTVYVAGDAATIGDDVNRAIRKADLWDEVMDRPLGIEVGEDPVRSWRPPVRPGQTLAESAGIIARGYVAQVIAPVGRIGLFDAVSDRHDARVALRRLRYALRLYQRLWDADAYDDFRAELRWFGKLLGGVRDLDVALGWLRTAIADVPAALRPALGELEHETVRKRRAALHELDRELRGDRVMALMERAAAWAEGAPVRKSRADRLLMEEIPGRLRDRAKKIEKTWGDGIAAHEGDRLHALRIRCRLMRYAAEAWYDALGPRRRRLVEALVAAQDSLGDIHDADVRIAHWAPGADGDVTAWLRARCERERAEAWTRFTDVWPNLIGCLATKSLNRVIAEE